MSKHLAKVLRQIRFENRTFWRNPAAAFFTILFPLMMLLIFATVFGNEPTGLGVTTAQFYAPALAVFGAVSAAYTSLAIGTAIARDQGVLKRVRGTPLPPWAYMTARIGSSVWLAALSIVLMLAVGMVFYDLQIRT
ncbi:MAG: ABC transporter permease, partial [Acidimicrobiia bacterium]|nr:ABC transporter permease [Acidimicrobiia bacterium]